jgi:hypothetical protein
MATSGQPIARIPFADGTERDVLQENDGRQFVADDNGEKVFGYWFLIDDPDEPAIVDVDAE